LSSIVIIIVILAAPANERSSGSFVFGSYYNGTGLEGNDGYVALIGLLTTLFAFSGYEAGGHMAEETQNARKSAPRGIVACCVTAAILGIMYILGLLFSIPEGNVGLNAVINGYDLNSSCNLNYTYANANNTNCTTSGIALTNLFNLSIGPTGGLGLAILILLNVFFGGISSVTVTSRIAFAMSRDGALPASKALRKINKFTKSPVRVVILIYFFDSILLLLQLANSAAFSAIISLTTIGFQISYAIPIWLRVTQSRKTFQQGAFNLGRYSIACGWISASWLTFSSLLFFWPFSYPVTVVNMNYTCVVVGSVAIISITFWLASARFWFKGPKKGANDMNFTKKGEEQLQIIEKEDESKKEVEETVKVNAEESESNKEENKSKDDKNDEEAQTDTTEDETSDDETFDKNED